MSRVVTIYKTMTSDSRATNVSFPPRRYRKTKNVTEYFKPNNTERLRRSTGKRNALKRNTMKTELRKGKVHPCTGTEALYRPYGP